MGHSNLNLYHYIYVHHFILGEVPPFPNLRNLTTFHLIKGKYLKESIKSVLQDYY